MFRLRGRTGLEVHRVGPLSVGGENTLSNLCTLCSECHRRAHEQRSQAEIGKKTDEVRWIPPLSTVRRLVRATRHPLDRLLVALPAKTGVGVGELCNLRCSDVSLPFAELYPEQLDGRKSVLRVRVPTEGAERPGRRERKSDTLVPLDNELALLIADWTRVRPDTPRVPVGFDVGVGAQDNASNGSRSYQGSRDQCRL